MKTTSLRWRLVRQLIMLQLAVSVSALLVLLGVVWMLDALVDTNGDRTAAMLARALQRAPAGGLRLAEGPEARWLQAAPGWWFIAHDGTHVLKQGEVPERYAKLVLALDGAERSSLDLLQPTGDPQARFERVQTAAGPLNLIVKTRAPLMPGDVLRGALLAYLVLMAPMALFTSVGFIVTVPWVVKRGLRGIELAAQQAEGIDIGRRTTRLPLGAVPSEVAPLMEAINRALGRLNEGYDRQERFLADAAHELRTPIATTRLQIEALPDGSGKAALLRSVQRLTTLAEHLLDLQRMSLGAARNELVDLKELCERVVADLAPLAIASHCQLGVMAGAQQFVHGDQLALERALANLIQNAIEHGGENCEVLVVLHEGATVEVCDTGPGIPESERERVMEAFHRVAPRGRGAGLGLHLVAEVARRHSGRLTVGATPQGGASLRLELVPAHEENVRGPADH